jgi:CRP/FNR family transcriptional regulator, cyclic AMP receptor protein
VAAELSVHQGLMRERATRPTPELVRVLELDSGLRQLVREERLRRIVVVDALRLPVATPLRFDALGGDAFALLVLEGLLCRRVRNGNRTGVELLGPGDVLRPWQDEPPALRAGDVTWLAVEPARVAVLDREFLGLVARSPEVLGELMSRLVHRCHALADRLALTRIPRLEERLLALLRQLGERWGHVERDRVTIPLPLRHALLADLVCAQRPPVTAALNRLSACGRIERNLWRGWDLLDSSQDAGMCGPLGVQAAG